MTSTTTSRQTAGHEQDSKPDRRAPDVIPVLRYRDGRAAIEWLGRAFGLEACAVHEQDQIVQHAELRWGTGMVMIGTSEEGDSRAGSRSGDIYLIVDDVDAHCARARAAGARIVLEPTDQAYGSRDYQALDPEGHRWSFGTYRPA